MTDFLAWLLQSSKDPQKLALTVRALLVGAIPTALMVISSLCGFGLICLSITNEDLNQLAENLGTILEGFLYVVSGIMFVWGFFRKITNNWGRGPQ